MVILSLGTPPFRNSLPARIALGVAKGDHAEKTDAARARCLDERLRFDERHHGDETALAAADDMAGSGKTVT
jgi:hypothetical protein